MDPKVIPPFSQPTDVGGHNPTKWVGYSYKYELVLLSECDDEDEISIGINDQITCAMVSVLNTGAASERVIESSLTAFMTTTALCATQFYPMHRPVIRRKVTQFNNSRH